MIRMEGESKIAAQSAATGRVLVVAAAILWSSSGLFAKAAIFADWPTETRGTLLAFWRALFAGLLILPAVRSPRWHPKLLPMAFVFAAMNVVYLRSMTLTTAANAIWLQNTAPWWVFLFCTVVLRHKVNPRDLIPLGFGMLGVGTILFFEFQQQAGERAGIIYGLVSAVTYAAIVLFLRELRLENAAWLVATNHLVTAAVVSPYVAYHAIWPTPMQLVVLAAFGFVQMAFPYVLFARGLKSIGSQEATGITLLEPVLLPIWVYLAWGEEPAWWTLLGAALILVGLALRYGWAARRSDDV